MDELYRMVSNLYAERGQAGRLNARILAWAVGLVVSSIAKFANHTNNPVWLILHSANSGWNKTGLVTAILSLLPSTRPINMTRGDYSPPGSVMRR
jgi:hypothetical protein